MKQKEQCGAKPDFSDSQSPLCILLFHITNSDLCRQCAQRVTALQSMHLTNFINSTIQYEEFERLFMLFITKTFRQKVLRWNHAEGVRQGFLTGVCSYS